MASTHVKKNDEVVVISGVSKGRRGRVLTIDREKGRVVVEGCNVRRKTVRRSPDTPQGGITEVECPIHISNVMLQDVYDARQARRQATAEPQTEPEQEAEVENNG